MSQINWNALYGFWLVAEYGSFADAARTLPQGSVQALHKRVRRLEQPENLNLKLLKSRGVRGIQLTEAGQRLHDFVHPIFKSFDVVTAELRGEDGGPLAVAMSGYAISNYAGDILRDLHQSCPAVSVRLHACEPAGAIALLEQGHVDFAISSSWMASRRLVVKTAAPIRFELVAAPEYRLGSEASTWPELLENPMVLIDRNSVIRQAFEDMLRRFSLLSRLRIGAEVATVSLAIDAVRAGFGVGLVPVGPAWIQALSGLRRLEPPPGLPRIDIALLGRRDVYLPRYMRTFVEIVAGRL